MDEGCWPHPHAKLFYRPIEVAIRWCGLMDFESLITQEDLNPSLSNSRLKQWPCLNRKLDVLWDAIRHKDLPYGCMGITNSSNEQFDPNLLTIRHAHLKSWMTQYHPADKPTFLFSELERCTLLPANSDLCKELLIQIEISNLQYAHNQSKIQELDTQKNALLQENALLKARLRDIEPPTQRSQKAYLCLIGALVNLVLGHTPSGKPYSSFTSQSSIISALMAHNRNKSGFSQRTLEEKFAAAKRSMDDSE
jgi:hypothetical protein